MDVLTTVKRGGSQVRTLLRTFAIVAVVAACGASGSRLSADPAAVDATAQAPADLAEADRTAVKQVVDDVARTLLSANFAAWAGLFSEDAVIYSPNIPMLKGRAVIQKWGEAFPPITELTFSNVEVWGQGNLAYATSGYTFATKGSPVDTGKQLWVFRRGPGARWEVVAASYNSDLPVPK
jgi:ketosteroid isomerase-like protein